MDYLCLIVSGNSDQLQSFYLSVIGYAALVLEENQKHSYRCLEGEREFVLRHARRIGVTVLEHVVNEDKWNVVVKSEQTVSVKNNELDLRSQKKLAELYCRFSDYFTYYKLNPSLNHNGYDYQFLEIKSTVLDDKRDPASVQTNIVHVVRDDGKRQLLNYIDTSNIPEAHKIVLDALGYKLDEWCQNRPT